MITGKIINYGFVHTGQYIVLTTTVEKAARLPVKSPGVPNGIIFTQSEHPLVFEATCYDFTVSDGIAQLTSFELEWPLFSLLMDFYHKLKLEHQAILGSLGVTFLIKLEKPRPKEQFISEEF